MSVLGWSSVTSLGVGWDWDEVEVEVELGSKLELGPGSSRGVTGALSGEEESFALSLLVLTFQVDSGLLGL